MSLSKFAQNIGLLAQKPQTKITHDSGSVIVIISGNVPAKSAFILRKIRSARVTAMICVWRGGPHVSHLWVNDHFKGKKSLSVNAFNNV